MKPATRRRLLLLVALALVAAAAAVILWLPPPGQGTTTGPAPLAYLGARSCEQCHAEETRRWRGSHHDLAMQEADAPDRARRLRRRAASPTRASPRASSGRTAGPSCAPTGPTAGSPTTRSRTSSASLPLQQYLVELPGRPLPGPLHRLGQPAEGGGRAALVPPLPGRARGPPGRAALDEALAELEHAVRGVPLDEPAQGLRPGRRTASGTTFSEIDVSCEACHGPGSRHVEWAERGEGEGAGAEGGPRPGRALRRAAQPRVGDGRGARDREAHEVPGDPIRGRDLRSLPRPARPPDRGVPAGPAARRHAPPGAARGGALLRRRADAGRGLQLGLVPPEPDVREGRHLLGLPRRPRPEGQGRARRRLLVVPPARALRDAEAPLPPGGRQGRLVRRLPHADGDLHGRGPAARSLVPRPAPRPHGGARAGERPQRVQRLPPRPLAAVGGAGGAALVPRRAAGEAALGLRPPRGRGPSGPPRRRRCSR